jgi:hypothetical protein
MVAAIAATEILDFALAFMQAAPALIEAGANVQSLFQGTSDSLKKMQEEGRGPNQDEWDAMNNMIASLRSELHAPDAGGVP